MKKSELKQLIKECLVEESSARKRTKKKPRLIKTIEEARARKIIKSTNKIVEEGQFSWLYQSATTGRDTGEQIITGTPTTTYMTDNKGNEYKQVNYEGYGKFGGKDFYELMSEMNDGPSDRGTGIDMYFSDKPGLLYPALTLEPIKYKTWDFTNAPKQDPNQGRD
jgi:hypothetical protein